MRLSLAIFGIWLLGISSAFAQSEDWLVLPMTESGNEAGWMEPTVAEVSRELRRQGIGVWTSAHALAAFERRGSAPAEAVSATTIEAWEARSQSALLSLAHGEYARALGELEQARALSDPSLVELNREPARAQKVLDTCLYTVRALLETGDEAGAKKQAGDCVRSVPKTEPSRYMHPPAVADLYAEASRPSPIHQSILLVEGEPTGCALRVNGVLVGRTPFEMTDLYPGEYRVQVECTSDAPGRVHPVRVVQGRNPLFIVDRFDRAVRATPVLHLQYAEPTDDARRARDARELARALPAAAIVVVSKVDAQTLELRLVGGARKESAFARIPSMAAGPDPTNVARGTASLLSGECRDLTGAEPVTLDCATGLAVSGRPVGERSRDRPPRGQLISGLTLASAGAASLLTGYGLLIVRSSTGDDWIADPGNLDTQNKWLNLGTSVIVTGSAGAALLVTAMPLALPYEKKTPWWGWLTGGLGLGLGAASVALAVTADPKPATSCKVNTLVPEPCVDRGRRTDLAMMLGLTAAPLLTVPLVYWFRKDEKKLGAELTPGVLANRGGGGVYLRGSF